MAPCFQRLGLRLGGYRGTCRLPGEPWGFRLKPLVNLLDGNRLHTSLCDIDYVECESNDHREDVIHFMDYDQIV